MNRRIGDAIEPWRFVLIAVSIIAAIPCGIAAAAPVWNGADLGVLICLAIFIAAFTIPSKEPAMTVKLSAALPKEFDANGMERLHAQLVQHPERRHLVVMVIDTAKKQIDYTAGGEVTPVAGVLFIEPIRDPEDVDVVTEIMARVRAERTGDGALEFDFGVSDPFADTMKRMRDEGITVTVNGKDRP